MFLSERHISVTSCNLTIPVLWALKRCQCQQTSPCARGDTWGCAPGILAKEWSEAARIHDPSWFWTENLVYAFDRSKLQAMRQNHQKLTQKDSTATLARRHLSMTAKVIKSVLRMPSKPFKVPSCFVPLAFLSSCLSDPLDMRWLSGIRYPCYAGLNSSSE